MDNQHTNYKVLTIGFLSWVAVILQNVDVTEVYQTAICAAVGITVTFTLNFTYKLIVSKISTWIQNRKRSGNG